MSQSRRFIREGDQVMIGTEPTYTFDKEYSCCLKHHSVGRVVRYHDVGNFFRGRSYIQYIVKFPCGHQWPFEKEELH